jgi:hypothetical protein
MTFHERPYRLVRIRGGFAESESLVQGFFVTKASCNPAIPGLEARGPLPLLCGLVTFPAR